MTNIHRIDDDELLVRGPVAAGASDIDVSISSIGFTGTFENVIRVAGSAYDDSVYERVMIPVIYNGAGAFGSQWRTDIALHNTGATEIAIRGADSLDAGETRPLPAPGNAPAGYFLDIGRFSDDVFEANALVRDLSRQQDGIGTEMPIVREHDWRRGKIVLMNVPGGANYRVTVRAYLFDGTPSASFSVPYRVYAMNGTAVLAQGQVFFTRSDDGPSFGTFEAPQTASGLLRYEIGAVPKGSDRRLWAFATVTNNTTQHVTIISPQ